MQPFTKTFKRGAHLFHENDYSRELYIIQEGIVRVYRKVGGRDVELARLHKGAVLGEMALIDGKPRSASVQSVEDCTVVIIDADTFFTKTRGVPQWFMGIIRMVSQKVRNANKHLQKVHSEYPGVNIVLTLQHMLNREEQTGGAAKGCLDLAHTREQLVQLLSTTTQQVVTVLDFLDKHGLISVQNENISISTPSAFVEYCTFLRMLVRKAFLKTAPVSEEMQNALIAVNKQHLDVAGKQASKDVDGSSLEAIFRSNATCSPREIADALIRLGLMTGRKARHERDAIKASDDSLMSMQFTIDCAAWRQTILYNRYKNKVFAQ